MERTTCQEQDTGFVSAFGENGTFLGRIGNMGALNSPWGLAIAPSGFGSLAGDLLVGNFGDGRINIFSADPNSPAFLETVARKGSHFEQLSGPMQSLGGGLPTGGLPLPLQVQSQPTHQVRLCPDSVN